MHHFNLTLLNFEFLLYSFINSLYLSLRVSAIDNQESDIKSLLAGPNQSLFTVVTLVFSVCLTISVEPIPLNTRHPLIFRLQPIFGIVSITLGFYLICLNKF